MRTPIKLGTDTVRVDISDGLFSLVAPGVNDLGDDGPDGEAFVDEALEGGKWVAQRPGEILVVPPQQHSYGRPLTVEQWDSAPPPDLDEWDDVCEASLDVASRGVYWLPLYDQEGVKLPISPGRYRLRISAKNIAPGHAEVGTDEWLIQAWPTDDVVAPERLARAA